MKWVRLIIPLFFCLILFLKASVLAQETALDSISATVKISVCGNGEIEGGEDCEGENLNGQTCESLGYGSGTLSCDIACSFDTTGCSPVPTATPTPTPTNTPTPTLTPTPTATLTPTPTSQPGPTDTPTPAPAATNTPAPAATATPTSVPAPSPVIPPAIAVFDIDGSGRIEIGEVLSSVKSWVEEWKNALIEEISPEALPTREIKKCDLNRDRRCDLKDLSILLYYIGK